MPFGLVEQLRQPQSPGVTTRRLEAFSDAVFAIAITLLALELRVPELLAVTPHALAATLAAQWPTYLSFLLSFVTLLIAWVYHHRLLQGVRYAGTRLLFTNGILLLVVSLGALSDRSACGVLDDTGGLGGVVRSTPGRSGRSISPATTCSGGRWRSHGAKPIDRAGVRPRA